MLQDVGSKPSKEERKAEAARDRLIRKVFGDESQGTGFADPAVMFGSFKQPSEEQEQ